MDDVNKAAGLDNPLRNAEVIPLHGAIRRAAK